MRQVWLPVLGFALTGLPLGLEAQERQQPPAKESVQALTVRGKVVRMEGKDRYVVRTNENKEVIFYTNPQTRYTIEGKAGKYADLRVGAEVNSVYTTRDDRYYVNTVTVGGAVVPRDDDPPIAAGTTLRGKIVRVEGTDRYVVRTNENKEVIFYTSPQSRYIINGKAGRYADLRVGAEVNSAYTLRDDRHVVNVVTVGAVETPRVINGSDNDRTRLRGKIVKLDGDDRFVIRTTDNKEFTLTTTPQAKYVINGKAGRITDLRIGVEVDLGYTVRDDRYYVETVTVGPAATDPAEGTAIQGTVVRIVGEDQVVVKTTDNKEVIIYIQPQTKYLVNDEQARFTDLRSGSIIRVQYDERDQRRLARSIFWKRK